MACSGSVPVIAIVGAGCSGTLLASQLLRQAQHPLRLLLIERSGRLGPGYRLHFNGHASIQADQVVLAWGNSALPPQLQASPAIRHGWSADATADLDPDAAVALLGTGLIMVDMLVSLQRRGHRSPGRQSAAGAGVAAGAGSREGASPAGGRRDSGQAHMGKASRTIAPS